MRRLPSELNEWKTSRSALATGFYGKVSLSNVDAHPGRSTNRTMPRLRFNRKDARGRMKTRSQARPENAFSVAVSWPPRSHAPATSELWSHRLVIGSAATLRRNPRDVTVGVFHVAGFAVNTILSIDDEPGSGGLLDPLIYRRRTITARWAGKDIVLGRLLQGDVGDLQVHRLVLFVIGVGQEHR